MTPKCLPRDLDFDARIEILAQSLREQPSPTGAETAAGGPAPTERARRT